MKGLASHNTFTYLKPSRWWMRLLAFTARCQRINYASQIDLGASMFDLRVRFGKYGKPVICHGLIEYIGYLSEVPFALLNLNERAMEYGINYYVRVVLEKRKPTDQDKERFKKYCSALVDSHRNVTFFGGNDRSDWSCQHPIYDFGTPMPDIDEKHASTTALFPRFPRLDDLWPWLYARLFNHRNIKKGTTHDWLMIDFVDIQ